MTDWFDDLPPNWSTGRLKNVIASVQTGVWGDDADGGADDILCVRVADFERSVHCVGPVRTLRSIRSRDRSQRLLQPGDILLEKSGGTDANPVGFSVLFCGDYPAVTSNFISRIRLRHDQSPKYWLYAMAASYATRRTERSVRRTTGIQNLDQTSFFNEVFPRPPLDQQSAIAEYLDRVTAQIDMLIEEQQRLTEMLRERRQAAIGAALEPAPHWTRTRIKHIGATSLGKMLDAGRAAREGDLLRPYVRAADVLADGSVNLSDLNEMPFSAAELEQLDLRSEDVLLIEGGATVGRPGFLRHAAPGIAFQKTVNRLRVHDHTSARFVYWSMLRLYDAGYYASTFGAVSFVHLTGEKLREIELSLPPLGEQQQIAAALDDQTAKIDTLIAETERFIELARERRAALITAAVIGRINLRVAKPPEAG